MFGTNAEIKIFKIDLALSHNGAGRNDNRRGRASCLDFWQKQLHEKKVREVVDAELHFKTILGPGERAGHDTSHKDHMINLGHICEALLNCLADVVEISELNVEETRFDIGLGLLDLFDDRRYLRLGTGAHDEELGISGSQLDGEFTCDGLLGDTSDQNCRGRVD